MREAILLIALRAPRGTKYPCRESVTRPAPRERNRANSIQAEDSDVIGGASTRTGLHPLEPSRAVPSSGQTGRGSDSGPR